jgi:hypothetical protein
VSASSIDPMLPATADIFLHLPCWRKETWAQHPRTRSSPPWSSWAIWEELPTHVPDLQDCSLKKWQGKYDEMIAENMIFIVLKQTMDSNRIFYLSRNFYNLQDRTCQSTELKFC